MPKDDLTLINELRDYASPKARLTRMINLAPLYGKPLLHLLPKWLEKESRTA